MTAPDPRIAILILCNRWAALLLVMAGGITNLWMQWSPVPATVEISAAAGLLLLGVCKG